MRFDLSKYKLTIPDPTVPWKSGDPKPPRVPLTSFELRELDGEDETAALDRARALMPAGRPPEQTDVLDVEISDSFVTVNDIAVRAPWDGHKAWPAKVRDFLRVAFRSLNDSTPDDIEDFAKAVRGVPAPTAPGSRSSGASSPGT